MRGWCRRCRVEWSGDAGFTAHLHPQEAHRCHCGRPTYERDGVCAHCQRTDQTATRTLHA